jgi:hypothetical protein
LRGGIPDFFRNTALLMITSNGKDQNRQAKKKVFTRCARGPTGEMPGGLMAMDGQEAKRVARRERGWRHGRRLAGVTISPPGLKSTQIDNDLSTIAAVR